VHYYKRNLGDYSKKAGRLSILQHGVYNLLIDACYDREKFPTLEEAIDWTWAGTTEEIEAVKFVLSKFFKLENGVYVQGRIQEEITEYHEFCAQQEAKGKLGGRPKGKANGIVNKPAGFSEEADGNPPASHRDQNKTLTTNHYPLTNKKSAPKKTGAVSLDSFIKDNCDESGAAIPITDPIFSYAESVALPPEFLSLCWRSFVEKYSDGKKKYIDWRAVFRTAVKENWLKLWWIAGDGAYQLTTAGKQAQKLQESQS